MSIAYPNIRLFIDGQWCDGESGVSQPVINPSTEETIGHVAHASRGDLDRSLVAAAEAFATWRRVGTLDRYRLLRRAADLLRERARHIGALLSLEQGKPLADGIGEADRGADTIDWFAEEGRRVYGRIVLPRTEGIGQFVNREPVGVVAAFTPWNFPINQAVRKVAPALAAGCTVILKGSEETPASVAELVRVFADAGLPSGVLNLVYGVPAEISQYLIAHRVVRKVSFTGSTAVGKQLASLAGQYMKRVTMELGGHAPVIVFEDADIDAAARTLAQNKFRNAGQICTSPTRFLIQESVHDAFVERFVAVAEKVRVGDGFSDGVQMGPLANDRRLHAIEAFVADAVGKGARIETGGTRIGNRGYFFPPTVLTGVTPDARIWNEEPFGPLAPIATFKDYDAAIREANRLPYGLAAYAYTRSAKRTASLGRDIESGMVSINSHGIGLIELPFGGIKDSGYGSEGGPEAMEAYLNTKVVVQIPA